MIRAATVVALAGIAAVMVQLRAQAPAPPTFDVASIKRSAPDASGFSYGVQPGGWSMRNASMATLIRAAFPSPVSELLRAPSWVAEDRYDVIAKASGSPTREETTAMLRELLRERLNLRAHYEKQDRSVYALRLAREDGRLGPALIRSNVDCEAVNAARRVGREPDVPSAANGAPPCTWTSDGRSIRFGGLPVSRLPEALVYPAGRVVIDKTNLAGNFELTLRYSTADNPTDDAPVIFTALEEQLGLRLVPDTAELEIVVIDAIERPTPD